MYKQLTANLNQATNLLIGLAVLGMIVTFGALRLTRSADRLTADMTTPSLQVFPPVATVARGQSIKLSAQALGFEPNSIVWLASDDQITLAPMTGAVTTVNIPTDAATPTITITATATLNQRSMIQDSITVNIE